eukprot:g4620.t1
MTDRVANAFTELETLLKNEQYRLAAKKADEILTIENGDLDALRCKVFALSKRNKFEEVVSASSGVADGEVKFCRAYAHYRLGNISEAMEIVKSLKLEDESAVLALRGQIFYKQGNFASAKNAFEQLLRESESKKDGSMEAKTNLLAALAASRQSDRVEEVCKKYNIILEDGFETIFNKACNFIELESYAESLLLLELALREGQETLLGEDWTQEEVDEELLPLSLQILFLKTMNGSIEDPTKELTEALSQNGVSITIKSTIENNLIAAKSRKFSDQPPKRLLYESAKKLEKMSEASSIPVLSPTQSITVRCNQALLLIALNHMEDATSVIESLWYEDPNNEKVKMTRAVWLAKQDKMQEAIEILDNIMSSRDGIALSPLLFKAQLLCKQGSPKAALKMLLEINDELIKYKGSLVATKIALMEQEADYVGCCELLEEVLSWWKRNEGTNTSMAIAWIFDRYSSIKIKQGDLKSAIYYCKEALESESDDLRRMKLISKFSRLFILTDLDDENYLAQQLPHGPAVDKEEVDALEGNINGTKRGEASLKKRTLPDGQMKKRKKKPRFPKNFDPESPGPRPDPERWLPKWQRSGYRRRTHGRKKDAVKGSQGAGKVDDSLDRRLNPAEASSSKVQKRSRGKGKMATNDDLEAQLNFELAHFTNSLLTSRKTAEVEISDLKGQLDERDIRVKDLSKAAEIWRRIAVARDTETKNLRLELQKLRSQFSELSSKTVRKAFSPVNTLKSANHDSDDRFSRLENLKYNLDADLDQMKTEMTNEVVVVSNKVHMGCQTEECFNSRHHQGIQTDPQVSEISVIKLDAECQTSDIDFHNQELSLRNSGQDGTSSIDRVSQFEATNVSEFSDGYQEDRDDTDCSPSCRTQLGNVFYYKNHPDQGPWKRVSSSFGSSENTSRRTRRSKVRSERKLRLLRSSSGSTRKATAEAPAIKNPSQSASFTFQEMDGILDNALKLASSHKDRALEQDRRALEYVRQLDLTPTVWYSAGETQEGVISKTID